MSWLKLLTVPYTPPSRPDEMQFVLPLRRAARRRRLSVFQPLTCSPVRRLDFEPVSLHLMTQAFHLLLEFLATLFDLFPNLGLKLLSQIPDLLLHLFLLRARRLAHFLLRQFHLRLKFRNFVSHLAQLVLRFRIHFWSFEGFLYALPRFLAFRQSKGQSLLPLVADHAHNNRSRTMIVQCVSKVAGIVNRLIAHPNDDVARAQPGLIGSAAFLHGPHQHSTPVLRTEKLTQLRREILHHQSASHRRMHIHHAHVWNLKIG